MYVCVSEHYIQCICRLKLFTSLILLFIDLAFINLKSIYHLSLQLFFLAPTILLFCLIYFLCCLASFTVLFLCHLPLLFHSFPLSVFYSVFINVLVQGWEGRRSGDMKHTSLQQKKTFMKFLFKCQVKAGQERDQKKGRKFKKLRRERKG